MWYSSTYAVQPRKNYTTQRPPRIAHSRHPLGPSSHQLIDEPLLIGIVSPRNAELLSRETLVVSLPKDKNEPEHPELEPLGEPIDIKAPSLMREEIEINPEVGPFDRLPTSPFRANFRVAVRNANKERVARSSLGGALIYPS